MTRKRPKPPGLLRVACCRLCWMVHACIFEEFPKYHLDRAQRTKMDFNLSEFDWEVSPLTTDFVRDRTPSYIVPEPSNKVVAHFRK